MSDIKSVDTDSFDQEVLQSSQPVLVDFWAAWCGPCQAMAPNLDAVAKELGDKLKVLKLNVDENPAVANRFQIQSIPTLLLFKNGQVDQSLIGFMPASELKKKLLAVLG